jgi:hypothetical protein
MQHIELVLHHVSIIAVRSEGVGLVASEVVGVEQRSNKGTSQGRWGSARVVEVE